MSIPSHNDTLPDQQADGLIKRYAFGSVTSAFIPIPYVDIVILIALQRVLLFKLSKIYNVPFKKNITKSMLATLMSGVVPTGANILFGSTIKMIPLIGTYVGGTSMAGLASASTYGVAKVFQKHFREGGNFDNFDAKKSRDDFKTWFAEGKQLTR